MADNTSGNLVDALAGLDFSVVSLEEFARIVKGLSVEQLGERSCTANSAPASCGRSSAG